MGQKGVGVGVGVAILGIGRWGTHLLRNFLEHPQAEVRAIADSHPENLDRAVHRFGLDDSIVVTTQWQEAIALPNIQAVVIATPASTHTELIRAALERGLHVMVEKPITLDVAEAEKLCVLAEQHQRCLVVDHTYLFNPAIAAGREVVQRGSLGDLRYGYASRTHLGPVRPDVDALWDLAIHDIAIFNHWLGDRPYQVSASGSVWLQPEATHPHLFSKGLADVVWARLLYPSGFQATVHLCWLNPDKQRKLCMVGDQGTLVFDEMQRDTPLMMMHGHLRQESGYFLPDGQHQKAIALEPAEPLKQVCTYFLDQIRGVSSSPFPQNYSDGQVGTDLIRVLTALSQSLTEGGRAIAIDSGEI